jgi:hypothetical protein
MERSGIDPVTSGLQSGAAPPRPVLPMVKPDLAVACRIGGINDLGGFQAIPADLGTSLALCAQ